jgi:hypothetical protein
VLDELASMDTRAKRRVFKDAKTSPPAGQSIAEQPLVRIEMSFWAPHLEVFGRKMIMSLFYQSFKVPLSPYGVMTYTYDTNFGTVTNDRLPALANMMPGSVVPQRAKSVLADQFSIRYATDAETRTGIYVLNFHGKLYLSGAISEDAERIKRNAPDHVKFHACFNHS